MFHTYILQSEKTGRFYTGHTADLESRLKRHNQGLVRSTKHGLPWKLVYHEDYQTKTEAYHREFEIKSYKSGIKFKKLVGLWKENK